MATKAPGLQSGLKIIEMVATSDGIGFNQLKTDLGLSPGSLNRYLKTLLQEGFVEKNENRQYVIGKKIKQISKGIDELDMIATKVQPVLENIAVALGSTSIYIHFEQGRMICAGKYMMPEGLTMQFVGEDRSDYILHPWGFLFLSSLDKKTRGLFIENANVDERFKSLLPDKELLNDFILEAGENGYSDDQGKLFQNIRRIAVPVYSEKKLVGAIGIGILGVSLENVAKENILKVLKQKAESLEEMELKV